MTRYRARLAGWLTLVGLVSAAGYAQRFGGGKPPKNALYHWDTFANEVVLFAFIAMILWVIAVGLDARRTFALRPTRTNRRLWLQWPEGSMFSWKNQSLEQPKRHAKWSIVQRSLNANSWWE